MLELSKEWFELQDHRKRLFSKAVWIPVYGSIHPIQRYKFPDLGHIEETLVIGTAVIFEEHKSKVEELDWHHFSSDDSRPFIDDDGKYHEAGTFFGWGNENIGFRLVLNRYLNPLHPRQVTINQDFISAYSLFEEGDKWLRPSDGYEEVIKIKRDEKGVINFVEIRVEYLRDYLAARKCALRLYYYRERQAILADDPRFEWPENHQLSNEQHDRCQVFCIKVNESGREPDAGWAVFRSWRTDVDPEDDVPNFSTNDNENTGGSSERGVNSSQGIRYRVVGEHWRAEWIEPAEKSVRLGYGEPDEDLFVSPDASGSKINLQLLNYETVGKYLWFKPELINTLLAQRGGHLSWYSAETGNISGRPEGNVHFGVNKVGLINAYAWDVARLPLWERRIWVSHNTKPDGGVCFELLQSQMECKPADTKSPEFLLDHAVDWLKERFYEKYSLDMTNQHGELEEIKRSIHRFRAVDEGGLRSLAKDVFRFSIERFNKKVLLSALGWQESKLGTIKLLEEVLASVTKVEFAKTHMAPLYGVYDLRNADAHLASMDIEGCYSRIGVDRNERFVVQGATLIKNVADTIGEIGTYLKNSK